MIVIVEAGIHGRLTPALLNLERVSFAHKRGENEWTIRVDGANYRVRLDEEAVRAAVATRQGQLPDFRVGAGE